MSGPAFTLEALAELVNARCVGDPLTVISGLGSLASATRGQISHLSSPAYREYLERSQASALILSETDLPRWRGNALVVEQPYLAFARISQLFARPADLAAGVHPGAHVDASAEVDESAAIGAGVCIGARTRLGPNVRLYPGSVVAEDCVIGAGSVLMPHVVLYPGVSVGERCVVHSGAVIGSDGFGFAPDATGHLEPIAQLGGVTIGDDVSIGAGTTIDRGAIDDTVVGDGVKIDNQVQVGHNCRIGAHTVICGCVGIAGSVSIGEHCIIAGACGIGGAGPIELTDRVVLTAATNVMTSITEPGTYSSGILHAPTRRWKRNALRFAGLDKLGRRVAALERRLVEKDEGAGDR